MCQAVSSRNVVGSQNQVWANSYTGDQHDTVKLQDGITTDVAKEIAKSFTDLPRARHSRYYTC